MTDFERGAEAMREAAVRYFRARLGLVTCGEVYDAILALPLPVQPPGGADRDRCTGHLVHDPEIFCPVHDA